LIGATSLLTKEVPRVPRINERRGLEVIRRIDAILSWSTKLDTERDTRFVELGKSLCEVRAHQFWRLEALDSFDQFLEKRFPDSRRKAYYLMSIHEQLPPKIRPQLAKIGWSKAIELVKIARHEKDRFDSAAWMRSAETLSKQQLKDKVDLEISGGEEPSELIYFRIYRSQMKVIDEAIEAAGLMLGSDYSRGYCLEMICADFLAGVAALPDHRVHLPKAILQLCSLLSPERREEVRDGLQTSL
jgi:hypothetical protein